MHLSLLFSYALRISQSWLSLRSLASTFGSTWIRKQKRGLIVWPGHLFKKNFVSMQAICAMTTKESSQPVQDLDALESSIMAQSQSKEGANDTAKTKSYT